jgi:G3E family GTPase
MLSAFADGSVLLSSLEGRSSFISEDVHYIYKKQLEEAGILIVNKSDKLTDDEIQKIQSILESEYPKKKLLFQDSRDETSIRIWVDLLKKVVPKKYSSHSPLTMRNMLPAKQRLPGWMHW